MEKFYKTYLEEFGAKPTSIVEIGSRDGHDSEKLRNMAELPSESVYIAEAHPDCAAYIRSTYPKVNLYNVAVFNKSGILDFNAIDYSLPQSYVGTSSLLKRDISIVEEKYQSLVKSQEDRWVKIIGITGEMMLQLIDRPMIDMMKIDVEGATYEVLKSFGDNLRLIKLIHVESEFIPVWKDQHLFNDVADLLTYYGFKQLYLDNPWPDQNDTVWKLMD